MAERKSWWAQIHFAAEDGPGSVICSPSFTAESEFRLWVAEQRRLLAGRDDWELLPYCRYVRDGGGCRDVTLRVREDGGLVGPPPVAELRSVVDAAPRVMPTKGPGS